MTIEGNDPEKLHAPAVSRKLVDVSVVPTEATNESEVSKLSNAEVDGDVGTATSDSSETTVLQPLNPEDKERPTQGIPKLRQEIEDRKAKSAGREPVIIRPNAQEAHQRQLRRIERKKGEVEQLTMGRKRIFFTVNGKGGAGKTPLTGYMCNIQMDITRVPTLCVDANETGSIHSLFGTTRENTLQLRNAVYHRRTFSSYDTIAEFAYKHHSGALLIGSDPQKAGKAILTLDAYIEAALIWNKAFPPLYIDSGNGFSDVPVIGSAMVANVMFFVALSEKHSSFEHVVETMIRYQDMGFAAKVNNGFLVINATKPGDTKRFYLDKIAAELTKFPKRDVYNEQTGVTSNVERRLEDLGITEERLFLIPFSPHIKEDGVISTDQNVIGLDTYEAYLDLLIAAYRQYAVYPEMTIESLSVPEPVDTDQLFKEASGFRRPSRAAS